MENWKKNERTKLLKTKTECIEWLELQTSQLLTQQKEDEKVRRAIGHLSKMKQHQKEHIQALNEECREASQVCQADANDPALEEHFQRIRTRIAEFNEKEEG